MSYEKIKMRAPLKLHESPEIANIVEGNTEDRIVYAFAVDCKKCFR